MSKPIIIHYCNSPTRYLHGLVTEVDHQSLPFFYRLFLPFFKSWLRLFDLNAVNNLNKKRVIWVGNSKFCSQMIKNIYKTDSQVIYPPIELEYFFGLKRLYKPKKKEKNQKVIEIIDKIVYKNLVNSDFDNDKYNSNFGDSKNQTQNKNTNLINIKLSEQKNLENNSQNQKLLQNDFKFVNKTTKQNNSGDFKSLEQLELIKKLENEDYYYYFGRISFHKRVDLTILACLRLGKKFKICGASAFPAEMEKLKNLVVDFENKNPEKTGLIEFLGRLDDQKRDLYLQYCRGFIFPAKEDFGIAPVEVLASGVPIIAYKAGGALEYVIEKKIPNYPAKNQKIEQDSVENENLTNNSEFDLKKSEEFENSENNGNDKNNFNGVFFQEQSVESLSGAILEFEKIETWNTDFIRQSVLKFDQKYFKKAIKNLVEKSK